MRRRGEACPACLRHAQSIKGRSARLHQRSPCAAPAPARRSSRPPGGSQRWASSLGPLACSCWPTAPLWWPSRWGAGVVWACCPEPAAWWLHGGCLESKVWRSRPLSPSRRLAATPCAEQPRGLQVRVVQQLRHGGGRARHAGHRGQRRACHLCHALLPHGRRGPPHRPQHLLDPRHWVGRSAGDGPVQ